MQAHPKLSLPLVMLLVTWLSLPSSAQALKPQPLPPADSWLQLLGALFAPAWDILDLTPPDPE